MEIENYPNVAQCSLPKETPPNAEEYCNLVRNTISCGLFVNLIDFMKIFFCELKLSIIPAYGLCNVIILIALFSMLHMVAKYFFFPNVLTLMESAPFSKFGSSYLLFGPCLLMPYFTSAWPSCAVREENLSPLQFAKLVGDIMKHFLVGIMVICLQGYRVEPVNLWSSISFLLVGMVYLLVVSNREHYIHDKDMGSSKDLVLLEFRVLAFLYIFGIALIVILVVSYTTLERSGLKEKKRHESYANMDSDDEVLGSHPKQRVYSRHQIWVQTVDGNKIMQDSNVVHRFFMVPIFFVLAHFIPVISKDRFQMGWVKYINCLCFLALPVLCLFYKFGLVEFLFMAIVCCTASLLVFISTHSMRRPDHVWLYCLLGLLISSMAMSVLSREIENLIWQYIGLRFNMLPDLNALMYFGLGEMFTEAIVVRSLQLRGMWDTCFGVVISTTTYGVFLSFPLLYYHGCYHPNCKIISTALSGTCILFIILMLSTSLIHISMSGYEFRMSLFFYLMGEIFIYVIFQWMRHHDSVFPLTYLHNKN